MNNQISITAEISTKNRYDTTLALCIQSVIMQTETPDELIIYDDGEQKDLRNIPVYNYLFHMLDNRKIRWEVRFGKKIGQVSNHQNMLESCKTTHIWRLDDDVCAAPDCLAFLKKNMTNDVAVCGPLVLDPTNINPLPILASNKIEDIYLGLNIQWFQHTKKDPIFVDHIYSTLLYNVEAAKKAGGYPKKLSFVNFREETLFSYQIKRAGYKLIVDPKAITYHLKNPEGGIRSYNNIEYYKNDEQIFQNKLKGWGVIPTKYKFIVINEGLGDNFCFLNILPEIKQKFSDSKIVIATCYPSVFEDEKNITLISIAEAKLICANTGINFDDFSVYKWCIDHNWNNHLIKAFEKLYLE